MSGCELPCGFSTRVFVFVLLRRCFYYIFYTLFCKKFDFQGGSWEMDFAALSKFLNGIRFMPIEVFNPKS